jgi:hypothetical protein
MLTKMQELELREDLKKDYAINDAGYLSVFAAIGLLVSHPAAVFVCFMITILFISALVTDLLDIVEIRHDMRELQRGLILPAKN